MFPFVLYFTLLYILCRGTVATAVKIKIKFRCYVSVCPVLYFTFFFKLSKIIIRTLAIPVPYFDFVKLIPLGMPTILCEKTAL